MPLVRRVPKRGFTNIFRTEYSIVNVRDLERLEGEVTPERLAEQGIARRGMPVKVLGEGEIQKALTVVAHKFSKTAREKIEAAGGTCREYEA
jgi:large subunit ribosomal protein L15